MTALRLPWMLALRYAGLRGHSGLGRFISRLAMAGFIIGVAVLVTVLSVMNGFERELRERILSLVPAITLTEGPLRDWGALQAVVSAQSGVLSATPFVQAHAVVSARGRTEGGLLYGVDLAQALQDSPYRPYVRQVQPLPAGSPEQPLYLGSVLATKLGVQPGQRLNLFVSRGGARQGVRVGSFVVVGLLESGTELDTQLMVAPLDAVSGLKFGEPGLADGLRLAVADVLAAPQLAHALYYRLQGRYAVSDWTDSHGNLYEAIHMSKRLVALVLLVLVLVAGFNVVSGLVLLVSEKQADIAILKTLGLSPARLLLVFALQGTLIGSVGVLAGVVLGVVSSLLAPTLVAALEQLIGVQFLSSEIYPVSFLPSELQLADVLQVAGVSLLVSATVSLYPAWQAARVLPAETLRQD